MTIQPGVGPNVTPPNPSRRTLLGASALSMIAGLPITSAEARSTAPAGAAPIQPAFGVSVRAFGAIGDGQWRALSTRFATLAEAQRVYPFATRLDQSLDWAGIQAAIDSVEASMGCVVVPVGRFILSDSIRMPSFVTLQGESRQGSVIDNQNWPLNAPLIVNKDPLAFLHVTIRDLTLNGGSHAIRVRATKEVAGIVIDGVSAHLQAAANLEFSSLQTAVIRDCHLINGEYGLNVLGYPCNSVHLVNTRLGDHPDASIKLRSVDLLTMIGGSIEGGGGPPGKATIEIERGDVYANAISFLNVYFEATHEIVLRTRGATGVTIWGCKFTGARLPNGNMGPYRFDCGGDLIEFGPNYWGKPAIGPTALQLSGANSGLQTSGAAWSCVSGSEGSVRRVRIGRGSGTRMTLLNVVRSANAAPGTIVGRLTVTVDEPDGYASAEFEMIFDARKGRGVLAINRLDGAAEVELLPRQSQSGWAVDARPTTGGRWAGLTYDLSYYSVDGAMVADVLPA